MKIIIYFVLFELLYFVSCQRETNFPLDTLFKDVANNVIPSKSITEFKNMSLDSAVVHYDKFPEIFTTGFENALKSNSQKLIFDEYCKTNNIDLRSKESIYVIVAAFHKRLNNEDINIDSLKKNMYDLSEQINLKRYGNE